jgi:glycerophosphoryl diester phosphodiesterase
LTARHEILAPDWLIARPIAHRGLHCWEKGIVENTLDAARGAIASGYAIECDIQRSRDDEAFVFHDDTLERLTLAEGRLDACDAQDVEKIAYREGDQKIVSLRAFLDEVAGRVPIVVEIKSRFDRDFRLAERAAAVVADYRGPVALKSFDPVPMAHLRAMGVPCPLGLVAEASYEGPYWAGLSDDQRAALGDWRDYSTVEPDFLSWNALDLPHAVPMLCRKGIGMPVMTWTVRSEAERTRVAPWADQIVFERFEPRAGARTVRPLPALDS